jgi:uncharacterized protein (DUF924 family)
MAVKSGLVIASNTTRRHDAIIRLAANAALGRQSTPEEAQFLAQQSCA